jgi:aspartyl protease family protein
MNIQNRTKDSSRKSVAAFICALASAIAAASVNAATRVTVVGLFPGKAVVSIDGKDPRTISIGEKTGEGVKLIATSSDSATLEIDGKRHTLDIGQMYAATGQSSAPDSGGSGRTINLAADGNGHFLTFGQINGRAIQFLVDPSAVRAGSGHRLQKRPAATFANGERCDCRVSREARFRSRGWCHVISSGRRGD